MCKVDEERIKSLESKLETVKDEEFKQSLTNKIQLLKSKNTINK